MKSRIGILLLVASAALSVQGCISFPQLVHVQKGQPSQVSNQDVMRRLDEIGRRLATMEQQQTAKQAAKLSTP